MCVYEKNILGTLVGDENYNDFIGNVKAGKVTTGQMALRAADLLDERRGSAPLSLARKRVNYCRLINRFSPKVLPAVLRFAMKEQHHPFRGLTLKVEGQDGIILDGNIALTARLHEILVELRGINAQMPQATMRLCQGEVIIKPEEHMNDMLIAQLSGQSRWDNDLKPEHQTHDVGRNVLTAGLHLNENDFIFLPSGMGYRVVPATRLSLFMMFTFEREAFITGLCRSCPE